MDFSQQNIARMLEHSLPVRFSDIPPTDFEDFMAEVFRKLGYSVEQTRYSGDFGADLVVSKAGNKIAVQVKRYSADNHAGVQDVNQVLGAKAYYKCTGALIITTSDYTKPAHVLMEEAGVENWNWDRLQKTLCGLYLGGRDVYDYLARSRRDGDTSDVTFTITKISYNMEMQRIGRCTLVHAAMRNSGANALFSYAMPIYISKSNNQVTSCYWYEGFFSGGMVYSGASVELAFMFRTEQVRSIAVGDRFIFNLVRNDGAEETYDVSVEFARRRSEASSMGSHGSCYVATMCYGRDSWEYNELSYFRDHMLARNSCGRWLVGEYYRLGGILVAWAQQHTLVRVFLKLATAAAARGVRRLNDRKRRRDACKGSIEGKDPDS